MAPWDGRLLVLGSVPGPQGRAPSAWITDGERLQSITVQPHSDYAFLAEFMGVGTGARILLLGQAFGGAHSNQRMTVWGGDTGTLAEHPQAFELFGGPHALIVSGAAALRNTDLLIGGWDGSGGRYGAAVWTSPDAVTWQRNATDPALSSAPGELTGASGVTTGPPGFVIVGDTVLNSVLYPLEWTSPDGRSWQRIPLVLATTDPQGGSRLWIHADPAVP